VVVYENYANWCHLCDIVKRVWTPGVKLVSNYLT